MQRNFLLNYASEVFIIAEIGVNHNGDINLAKQLMDVAKQCNANAVKFQTFQTDKLVRKDAPKAEYQKENHNDTIDNTTQYDMLKKLELSKTDFEILKQYATDIDIIFISSPFDLESVAILNEIGVDMYKVGSGECDNFLLLNKIIETKKPVIISTGMTDIDEIKKINQFMISNNYCDKYIFLHCVSAYPAPQNAMNMSCVKTMQQTLNVPIGFSDHTTNNVASIMAISYGTVCIEKHITLDNNMIGPDHKASLNPEKFSQFVNDIRTAEKMIGNGVKQCMECEENIKSVAKKNLYFTKDLVKGEIININDMEALRPNLNGVSPAYYYDYVGKTITNDVKCGDVVINNCIC